MVMRLFNSIIISALLLLPAISLAVQLEAVPDRTRVGLEESFTLELRANGSVDGDPNLSALEKDFELLGRSQASQIQIVNGDITRTTTWSLSLLARNSGTVQIPPLCIENDCSSPVAIQVLPVGESRATAGGSEDLLLEVSAHSEKVWVQSQLLYKVRLLTRLNFLQASLSEPEPTGVEAVVQKLGEDRNYETERNGLRYRVVERSYAIFPQQSGRLTIPRMRFAAQIADARRSSFDPFNQRTRQLRKHSEEISVEILPAPDSGGRNWLPSTDLQLQDDWQQQPPQLTVGEPATRTITLRASGLPAAQLRPLAIEIPEGVKSYPDQPSREDQYTEDRVTGILQQKVALVPTRPGQLHLPEVKVDWWDLQTESWRQTMLPALDLEILPAANQPEPAITAPVVQQQMPNKEQKPQAASEKPVTVNEPGWWPWLSLALAGGWLITLLLLIKSKSGNRKKDLKVGEEKGLSLKKARQELQNALDSGDQGQMRTALLDWGQTLFPDQPPRNLEDLAALCGNPLQQILESYNKSLYSRSSETWENRELLTAVQQAERDNSGTKTNGQLPPLYPR